MSGIPVAMVAASAIVLVISHDDRCYARTLTLRVVPAVR